MPSESHDVQSSAHTTTVMFHRLGLPVKPTGAYNPPVAPIEGFALGYPTRNPSKNADLFLSVCTLPPHLGQINVDASSHEQLRMAARL